MPRFLIILLLVAATALDSARGRDLRAGLWAGLAAACKATPLLFLPIFVLGEQSGRMFKPLAYTKTFAMLGSALLAITLVPVLSALLLRGRMRPPEKNILSRFLMRAYEPVLRFSLKHKVVVLLIAPAASVASDHDGDEDQTPDEERVAEASKTIPRLHNLGSVVHDVVEIDELGSG